MIRHIVMFQFKESADGRTKKENLEIAKEMLESLDGVVPTLKSLYVALNHEYASKENYDLVLVCEYEDIEGLNAYQIHPEHKKVSEFIGKVRETRACIDFTI
ncbi:Dabb family protein [Clostridium sp. Marseille-P299]|uniref:Dabb family protein n=1 Tax=Clostridium sp. Marseille-P299 TaxID=1805477 RepID=UPI00082CDADE|nr:Dabb family protein [Clostridium sp. Marseille-P299]